MTPISPAVNNKFTFYLARMAHRGFSAEQVLRGSGLREADVRVEGFRPAPDHYRRVIANMLELTGDPFLGLAMGSEFKVSDLGVLGYAALSSNKLAQSRELFTKYDALVEHIMTPASSVTGGQWITELSERFPLGGPEPDQTIDLGFGTDVDAPRGLVQNQNPGVCCKPFRQDHFLLIPTR